MDVRIGIVVRPNSKDFEGVEDLVIGQTEAGSIKMVRIKDNMKGFSDQHGLGSVITVSRKDYLTNGIFIREATKAEMVLYGEK